MIHRKHFAAVFATAAVASLASVPIALAAAGPSPVTYGVAIHGFLNNRLHNNNLQPNSEPLASAQAVHGTPCSWVGRGVSYKQGNPGRLQCQRVSADSAGNLYSVYSDHHNLWLKVSSNHGETWSGPYQVNQTGPVPSEFDPYALASAWLANPHSDASVQQWPASYSVNPMPDSYYKQELLPAYSNVSVEPLVVALDPGRIDIVWYGTNMIRGEDGNPALATTDDHVHWVVFMAQTQNALTGHPTFVQRPITPVVHRTGLLEAGMLSNDNGPGWFRGFRLAVNPKTGLASVVYTSDQFDVSERDYYSLENNSSHSAYAEQVSTSVFATLR